MEVASAAVVTESFPMFEDCIGGGVCKGLKIWKALHPAFKIREHGFNLRLLKHEFRNNRAVEARLGAPR